MAMGFGVDTDSGIQARIDGSFCAPIHSWVSVSMR